MMPYSQIITRGTDPTYTQTENIGPNCLVPVGFLPECDKRGCTFRFRRQGDVGKVFEHHETSGQVRGLLVTNEEIRDAHCDIWAKIKPYYGALHDDEEPA